MLKSIQLQTPTGEALVDITPQITSIIQESGIQEGICVLYNPHTTAGLTLNSALDTRTLQDIHDELRRLVPTRVDFHHTYDTPADAAGHIKATLVGNSLAMIITGGQLLLGSSQSILFCEFDGPRPRQVWMRLVVDDDPGAQNAT